MMASVAGGVAWSRRGVDFRPLDAILRRQEPKRAGHESSLIVRSLAGAGFAALLALPALLVASLIAEAPLAGPALIACGYLVVARVWENSGPAAAVNAAILVALVGWSAGIVFFIEEPFSGPSLAAALLAPFFAAAPAIARAAINRDRGGIAAAESVACLDRLAPSEAVLILDRSGKLRAATRRAGAIIGAAPLTLGEDVSRRFSLTDRRTFLEALKNCQGRLPATEIELSVPGEGGEARGRLAAVLTFYRHGMTSMRLREADVAGCAQDHETKVCEHSATAAAVPRVSESCDVREAMAFAMRRALPKAERLGVSLAADSIDRLAASCERQVCRRALSAMLDCALTSSRSGGTISTTAREGKGVVLVRVEANDTCEELGEEMCERDGKFAATRALIERAGGTILVERGSHGLRLSLRLGLAGTPDKNQDMSM